MPVQPIDAHVRQPVSMNHSSQSFAVTYFVTRREYRKYNLSCLLMVSLLTHTTWSYVVNNVLALYVIIHSHVKQIQICTECRDMLPRRLVVCQEARPGLLVSVFCTDLNLFYSIHCNFLFLHGLGWERCKTCKRLHKKKERKRQAHKQSQVKKNSRALEHATYVSTWINLLFQVRLQWLRRI